MELTYMPQRSETDRVDMYYMYAYKAAATFPVVSYGPLRRVVIPPEYCQPLIVYHCKNYLNIDYFTSSSFKKNLEDAAHFTWKHAGPEFQDEVVNQPGISKRQREHNALLHSQVIARIRKEVLRRTSQTTTLQAQFEDVQSLTPLCDVEKALLTAKHTPNNVRVVMISANRMDHTLHGAKRLPWCSEGPRFIVKNILVDKGIAEHIICNLCKNELDFFTWATLLARTSVTILGTNISNPPMKDAEAEKTSEGAPANTAD